MLLQSNNPMLLLQLELLKQQLMIKRWPDKRLLMIYLQLKKLKHWPLLNKELLMPLLNRLELKLKSMMLMLPQLKHKQLKLLLMLKLLSSKDILIKLMQNTPIL
jgi:hypothetical protein